MEEARIDGLVTLLSCTSQHNAMQANAALGGSSTAIRNQAAGEIAQLLTATNLPFVIARLRPLLHDAMWETRVAAADTIGAMAALPWIKKVLLTDAASIATSADTLKMSHIDLDHLLTHAAPLLRSGGEEYDYQVNFTTVEERSKYVAVQRQRLWHRLRRSIGGSVATGVPQVALERTRNTTTQLIDDQDVAVNCCQVIHLQPVSSLFNTNYSNTSHISSSFVCFPLLILDCLDAIFDAKWEVRHGAAQTLRNVFCLNEIELDPLWNEDLLVRGLSVLALESWVDYSGDDSIAPVRELIAQFVGKIISIDRLPLLLPYLSCKSWHAAHGGLLAIYYSDSEPLAAEIVHAIAECFCTRDEEELHAIAAHLIRKCPSHEALTKCIDHAWKLLEQKRHNLVDISPCALLKCITTHRALWDWNSSRLSIVVVYLRHAVASVRLAALACLETSIDAKAADYMVLLSWMWFALANEEQLRSQVLSAWQRILESAKDQAYDAVKTLLSFWCSTLWTLSDKDWSLPALNGVEIIACTSRKLPLSITLELCQAIGMALDCTGVAPMEINSNQGLTILSNLWVLFNMKDVPKTQLNVVQNILQNPSETFYSEQTNAVQTVLNCAECLQTYFPTETLQTKAQTWTPSQLLKLAQVVGQLNYETLATPEPYTTAQFLRQDIFTHEEKVRLITYKLNQRIAGAAAAVWFNAKLWTKPGILVKPWMESLKEDALVHQWTSQVLVKFLVENGTLHAACCKKVLNNLIHSLIAVDMNSPVSLSYPNPSSALEVRIEGARIALIDILSTKSPQLMAFIADRLTLELASIPDSDAALQGKCRLYYLITTSTIDTSLMVKTLCLWSGQLWAPDTRAIVSSVLANIGAAFTEHILTQLQQAEAQIAYIAAMVKSPKDCVSNLPRMVQICLYAMCNGISEAAACFASLVSLLPLLDQQDEQLKFFHQLLRATPPPFLVDPIEKLTWRPYQERGIQWLSFLSMNGLHGILADDMGLGKTLQVLASVRHVWKQVNAPKTLLVVCPVVIMEHWRREASRVFGNDATIVVYGGTSSQRRELQKKYYSKHKWQCDVVITSYNYLQRDIDKFTAVQFTHCIADEAHLIRNQQSLTAVALRQVKATYRIALTGTPIQNSVEDVWSLFEFIMPGYLGTWSNFRQSTLNPILASKKDSTSATQKEAGLLAMAKLHARIQPFVLRRTKEHVLTELPPKIIQDIVCALSPEQQQAYANCCGQGNLHNLQLLRQLQKICVHPQLIDSHTSNSIALSGKFMALKELLDTNKDHRFLIFCHLQASIELLATILSSHCTEIKYLRLDGSIPLGERQSIVDRYNSDFEIQALLLTTAIGGLGLNLTSADTVIFIEHSWNPFTDLQAMDRAHRLGQTKTVMVYRLLAMGTIEEDVMTCQRFKTAMAAAVIGTDGNNKSTNLDALVAPQDKRERPKKRTKGVESFLEEMGELWDEAQYDSLGRCYE